MRPSRRSGWQLERDVVVLGARCSGAARAAEAAFVVGRTGRSGAGAGTLELGRTRADHLEVVADDLGAVLLLAGLAIVPGARLDPAFDIDLLALGEVLAGDLGLPSPDHDVVPLGLLLALAVLVLPFPAGRQREARDRLPGGSRAHLRIAAKIADQQHFVQHARFSLGSESMTVSQPLAEIDGKR